MDGEWLLPPDATATQVQEVQQRRALKAARQHDTQLQASNARLQQRLAASRDARSTLEQERDELAMRVAAVRATLKVLHREQKDVSAKVRPNPARPPACHGRHTQRLCCNTPLPSPRAAALALLAAGCQLSLARLEPRVPSRRRRPLHWRKSPWRPEVSYRRARCSARYGRSPPPPMCARCCHPPPPVQAQLETRTARCVVGRVSAIRRHACHAQELQMQILDLYHNEDAPPPPLAKTSADTADKARPRVGSNSYKA